MLIVFSEYNLCTTQDYAHFCELPLSMIFSNGDTEQNYLIC